MPDERKLLVIPVAIGRVSFQGEWGISVDDASGRVDIPHSQIVGPSVEKDEIVMVLDLQAFADAMRVNDDELVDFPLNGTVTKKTNKAVFLKLSDNRIVSLPSQYVSADVEEFVSEVRLPRWLAMDRGL